jgi:hypothetical protein
MIRQCTFEKDIRKRLSETGSIKPKALENAALPPTSCMYTRLLKTIIAYGTRPMEKITSFY